MTINICAIAKNEEPYIKDWYNYYIKLGIDNIYFYDNNEDDHLRDILNNKDYPKLHYTYFPGTAVQAKVYQTYYTTYNKTADYHMFIDLDEYVCIVGYENKLKDIISQLPKDVEQIALPWIDMSDDNKLYYENKPLITRIRKIARFNKNVIKCIVKGGLDYRCKSAHFGVNSSGIPFKTYFGNGEEKKYEPNKIPFRNYRNDTMCNWSNIKDYKLFIKHFDMKTIDEYLKNKFGRTDVNFPDWKHKNKVVPNLCFFVDNYKTIAKLEVLEKEAKYNQVRDIIIHNVEDRNKVIKLLDKYFRCVHLIDKNKSRDKHIIHHNSYDILNIISNKDNWQYLAEYYFECDYKDLEKIDFDNISLKRRSTLELNYLYKLPKFLSLGGNCCLLRVLQDINDLRLRGPIDNIEATKDMLTIIKLIFSNNLKYEFFNKDNTLKTFTENQNHNKIFESFRVVHNDITNKKVQEELLKRLNNYTTNMDFIKQNNGIVTYSLTPADLNSDNSINYNRIDEAVRLIKNNGFKNFYFLSAYSEDKYNPFINLNPARKSLGKTISDDYIMNKYFNNVIEVEFKYNKNNNLMEANFIKFMKDIQNHLS